MFLEDWSYLSGMAETMKKMIAAALREPLPSSGELTREHVT